MQWYFKINILSYLIFTTKIFGNVTNFFNRFKDYGIVFRDIFVMETSKNPEDNAEEVPMDYNGTSGVQDSLAGN